MSASTSTVDNREEGVEVPAGEVASGSGSRQESTAREEGESSKALESTEADGEGKDEQESTADADAPNNTDGIANAVPASGSQQPGGAGSTGAGGVGVAGAYNAGDWQAVWSAPHNAYYFYNSRTGETTWNNPVTVASSSSLPSSSTSASTSTLPSSSSQPGSLPGQSQGQTGQTNELEALQAAALAAGIDPDLAYLDPTLLPSTSSTPSGAFTAKFNARTGAFTALDGRDPSHLSEVERAKRMSSVYFDVEAWERDVAEREAKRKAEEEEGVRKKKKISKKDLERFKEQKRLKKIAKTAWLRT
ncbi:hypothetical protein SISSUDRAFT_1055356 [Sistotremastrum suecicum HHB10207 ss-3]|uniref:WW domain-containing protein n=1 Tax=Sistotremastrum suecicum HHB10207 ss-3 TaxID=1314776 RepID=A0A165XUR2_9AGAM|nr:hypothetical protein SISSUDRAFT_1055356 [Sistotremastrum suecicum HHB10207 ss-3]